MTTISPGALALLTSFEGCPAHPEWPGGSSGITIGIGCDIGQDPDSLTTWKQYLPADDYGRLASVRGRVGLTARAVLEDVRDIVIPAEAAQAVLAGYILPSTAVQVMRVFPGSENMPADSFGALVSLVYNRGPSLTDHPGGLSRDGMRAIHGYSPDRSSWDMIPLEITDMARLWPGAPTDSNLPGRRYYEAHLFEAGLRGAGIVPAETLVLADAGDAVAALQDALRIGADGNFGPVTLRAIIAWQRAQGMPTHGIADPITLRSLGL